MISSSFKQSRVRITNDKPVLDTGEYVLYWMQAYRRLAWNHSLDYAIALATKLGKPLVVYEGLRSDYKWNSKRIHRFILEGMCDNAAEAKKLGINYWCYVETPSQKAQGLLKKISSKACAIVTDDFPCFIIPEQISKLSSKVECQVVAIDGNGIVPLSQYGGYASAARVLRIRLHKIFGEAYIHRSAASLPKAKLSNISKPIPAPFKEFSCNLSDIDSTLEEISFSNEIAPHDSIVGGRKQALKILKNFLENKLPRYGKERSNPGPPDFVPSSGLSAYLHFGHISAEEVITAVLDSNNKDAKWAPDFLNPDFRGKREGYFSKKEEVNSYLDELITWRDIGYLLFWEKKEFRKDLEVLPDWIKANFEKHKKDKRDFHYSRIDWENGNTHDPIWNAAQKELVLTGRMHNYMRMLWGKKIIEWSASYEEAFALMEDLNNLYAYDGRNPNSYTGILWCFGLFDRPWFPERKVLGNLRYMSSDSTKKKFKLGAYLDYINALSGHKESLF